jgi:hypothetical protein
MTTEARLLPPTHIAQSENSVESSQHTFYPGLIQVNSRRKSPPVTAYPKLAHLSMLCPPCPTSIATFRPTSGFAHEVPMGSRKVIVGVGMEVQCIISHWPVSRLVSLVDSQRLADVVRTTLLKWERSQVEIRISISVSHLNNTNHRSKASVRRDEVIHAVTRPGLHTAALMT